ncbi:MAG TPA: glycosyltransferase [Blastocatellia bacterium]|nr:glycosyltransferase [Blastocatellia bacterium]
MRILHFSTDDITGGAAKAAYRLHSALVEAGHDSQMIVLRKRSDDDRVLQALPPKPRPWTSRAQRLRDHIPGLRPHPPIANYTFNFDLQPQINLAALLANQIQSPEIICLHWVNGLLDVRTIRRLYDQTRCPIVWVMADQEPMTGGCHYSFGCEGFQRECGNCPQLAPSNVKDHSHLVWQRKKEFLTDLPICFVAPTSWGIKRLRESSLFQNHRCELIPYPIDTQIFRPINQTLARDLLHLPQEKKIIFFGASYLEDRRKGMPLLLQALNLLNVRASSVEKDRLFLLIAGLNGKQLLGKLPFAGKYLGQLNDDLTLALAYQAANIFACPSIEDAGPMMIPEAMMCGTPVIAFSTGGAPDLIETGKTGFLVSQADADSLAGGILGLLGADNELAMCVSAQLIAKKRHSPEVVAKQYLQLFASLIHNE